MLAWILGSPLTAGTRSDAYEKLKIENLVLWSVAPGREPRTRQAGLIS